MNWLDYYLGPTGIPDRLRAANEMFNPVESIGDSMSASRRMFDPELEPWDRVGAFGDMVTGMAEVLAPVAATRFVGLTADDAALAVEEALLGASAAPSAVAGRDFLADEAGAIRAWHGSPHDFDKFSMDKIGTGEGAQAYGHGLYFAENADTARNYKTALSPGMGKDALRAEGISETHIRALDQFTKSGVDKDVAYRDWLNWTGLRDHPAMKRAFDSDWAGRNDGRLYEVEIDANPEDFLDWDAPLSEQPEKVRAWFDSRGITEGFAGRQSGQELFQAERRALEDAPLAESLKDAGVAGVKYLDHGSRWKNIDGFGDDLGTRNYVVFDDNLISIIKKYGIAGAAAMLGMSAEDLQAQAAGQLPQPTEENKNHLKNYLESVGL